MRAIVPRLRPRPDHDSKVILDACARDLLIRDARRAAGLTQAELAARLGVSQSAIAKLEREGSNPTVETLDRVLRPTGHRLQLIAPAWGGVDIGLIHQALRRTPAERIKSTEAVHKDMRRIQVAARGEANVQPDLNMSSLLRRLADARVDYVVIGGVAVIAHGYERSTTNLEICPSDDAANLRRLAGILDSPDATQLRVRDSNPMAHPATRR